jgi:predicted KAP-like P-loop ATPase
MEQSSLTQFEGQVLEDSRLTLLGDGAQTVDLLGYQPFAEALVEVLAQRDLQTPFAVGVFGRWGTGKSTFMNLVRAELSLDERRKNGLTGGFHTVWFQPWQFEEKEEVWKALILSVIRYLEVVEARQSTPGTEEAERIKATLRELAKSVGKLALNRTIQTMTSGVVDLDTVLDAYAKTARDNSQFINTFREQFGELKTEILKQAEDDLPRLFVFVDDLDRCAPDNCIMVLEAIKLFFDLPECVFVLGIDREVVQRGIEEKYRDSLGIHGQDYIDKLIQLPFSLPPLRKQTFERFVSSITADFKFPPEVQKQIGRAHV